MKRLIATTAAVAALLLAGAAQAQTVILVRHAEKAAAPADDPPLTPAGLARAQDLKARLAAAGVTLVIHSEFQRTRLTAIREQWDKDHPHQPRTSAQNAPR